MHVCMTHRKAIMLHMTCRPPSRTRGTIFSISLCTACLLHITSFSYELLTIAVYFYGGILVKPCCRCRYWFRHAVGAWVELLVYALRRRRFLLLGECLCMESAYILAVYMLWQWRPVATLWTLVLPYCLSSLALMFGNW